MPQIFGPVGLLLERFILEEYQIISDKKEMICTFLGDVF